MEPKEQSVEGKSLEQGEAKQSTPPASAPETQPLPESIAAILKPVITRLDAMEKRISGVQKGADKQIRQQVSGSMARILELAKEGKSEAEIKRELWIDQLMQEKEGADSEVTPDKSAKEGSFDAAEVVDEVLQLPTNDSRVTALKLAYEKDKDLAAYMTKGLQLAASLAEKEEASPGEMPPPTGVGVSQRVENPIKDIDDPKLLYKMAWQQAQQRQAGKKRRRGAG